MMMTMKKKNIATATERSDFHRLVSAAIRATNSNTIDGFERCFDIMRYLKSLNLSVKDLLRHSKTIHSLASLRNHENPSIRMGANVLFNSWMKTLYSGGRNPNPCSDCNKSIRLSLKKPADVVRVAVSSKSKKKEDTKKEPDDVFKSVSTKSKTKKKQPPLKNPKDCQTLRKNSTEMLELFEIAKKSADVANTKGLLLAKTETSICVDTLSLLIAFPISSTAPDTRRIMDKLSHLTKHKDRKICNSASALVQHWSQSIRDQQHEDASKSQG